jgi:uncharacterized membrane protein YccC
MLVPLAVGALTGQLLPGLIVGIGVLNVSFLNQPDPYPVKLRRMLTASALAAVSAAAGAAVGRVDWLVVPLTAVWGFGGGLFVALGPRGAQMGLTNVILFVIFGGQVSGSAPAVDLGGLVFLGGALETLVAVIPWVGQHLGPERMAVAVVYRELAAYAEAPTGSGAAPPVSAALLNARDLLSASGGDQVHLESFWSLLNQAERTRLELTALGGLGEELTVDHDTAALNAIAEGLRAAQGVLSAIADTVQTARAAVDIPDPAPQLEQCVAALKAVLAAAQHAADGRATAIAEAVRRLDALGGQLRAATALAATGSASGASQEARTEASRPPALRRRAFGAILWANLTLRSAACRHAVRLAAGVGVAEGLTRAMHLPRAYWVPMTVAMVLQPDYGATLLRGVGRVAGTGLGLVVATVMVHLIAGGAAAVIGLVAILTFILRGVAPANYTLLAATISAEVVALLALAGSPPESTIIERGVNTAIGGILALAVYAVWPTWEEPQARQSLAEMLDAYRRYFRAVMAGYTGTGPVEQAVLSKRRTEARLARSNAEASIDRLLGEPGRSDRIRWFLPSLLAASHRLANSAIALEAHRLDLARPIFLPGLGRFVDDVDAALGLVAQSIRAGTPPPGNFPDLRGDHRRLIEANPDAQDHDVALVILETDRITNTVNTLADLIDHPEAISKGVGVGVSTPPQPNSH